MAKQIEGVYENVLRCARQEFLEKGFALASLRDIAKAAGTSTGSIYTRFTDKAGLFRALVEPAAGELKRRFLEIQESFHQFDGPTPVSYTHLDVYKRQDRTVACRAAVRSSGIFLAIRQHSGTNELPRS